MSYDTIASAAPGNDDQGELQYNGANLSGQVLPAGDYLIPIPTRGRARVTVQFGLTAHTVALPTAVLFKTLNDGVTEALNEAGASEAIAFAPADGFYQRGRITDLSGERRAVLHIVVPGGATATIGVAQFSATSIPSGSSTGGGGGGGDASAANQATEIARLTSLLAVEGAVADAAVVGDVNGSISAKLRGISKIWNSVWDAVNNLIHFNLKQIGGTNVSTGAGNTDAGTQRFVTAADGPLNTNLGTTADVAVTGDNPGSVSAKLRGWNKLTALITFKAASTAAVDADPGLVTRNAALGDRADGVYTDTTFAAAGSLIGLAKGFLKAIGFIADAVYTGSGSATAIGILKGIYAALTDGTADSLVHMLRYSNRQTIIFRVLSQTPGTSAETMLTMNWSIQGGAASSGTSYAPPAGKRLMFQTVTGFEKTPGGNTTAAPAKIRRRENAAGATTTASVEQDAFTLGGTTPVNFFTAIAALFFPGEIEIQGDGTHSFGLSAEIPLRAVTTADPAVDLTLVAYLY